MLNISGAGWPSGNGSLKVVKMVIFLKFIYRFNTIPIRSVLLIQANTMYLWHFGHLHQRAVQETVQHSASTCGSGSDCVGSNPRSSTFLLYALGQLIFKKILFSIRV